MMPGGDSLLIELVRDYYINGTDSWEYLPKGDPIAVGNFNTAILHFSGKGLSSPAPQAVVETSMDRLQSSWPTPVAAFDITASGETKQIKATDTIPLYQWLRVKVGKGTSSYTGYITVSLLLKR